MERQLVAKIEGRGVSDDAASILVYRLGDQTSVIATAERNGDTEVILSKVAAAALAEALKRAS